MPTSPNPRSTGAFAPPWLSLPPHRVDILPDSVSNQMASMAQPVRMYHLTIGSHSVVVMRFATGPCLPYTGELLLSQYTSWMLHTPAPPVLTHCALTPQTIRQGSVGLYAERESCPPCLIVLHAWSSGMVTDDDEAPEEEEEEEEEEDAQVTRTPPPPGLLLEQVPDTPPTHARLPQESLLSPT